VRKYAIAWVRLGGESEFEPGRGRLIEEPPATPKKSVNVIPIAAALL
jgi:hypothetical protein